MSRPMMIEDYLLIGGVLFVVLTCMVFLFWSFPSDKRSR